MQLLATAYNFQERNIPFMVMKSSIDTRDNGVIHSRCLGDRECLIVTPQEDITTVFEKNHDIKKLTQWILIDEAQFLTKEQVDQVATLVDYYNINVICYGLRTDFQTNLFEGSKRLFEIADSIEEIKSTCECGRKTIFNARVDSNGNVVTDGKQIEVGGNEKYVSMCRACYKKRIKGKK